MKKINKLLISCLAAIMILGLFAPAVSAKDLREKDQEARNKYQAARQQYLREINWWKTIRRQFNKARTSYRNFRNDENKAAYEEQARTFLEKTIDVLIKKLEALKNWVSNRRALSEPERESIIAEIEQDISWLQDEKSDIATATPDQIKEKAKEIRQYWKNHRLRVKRIIGQIWTARLSWVIERFENVSSKIRAKIDELEAAGKDTAQLKAWLDDFNQQIEIAKEKRDKAKEKYQSISDLADLNQLFYEAHQFIKEANQYLREAHRKLIEIIKEIRKLAASAETTE